MHGKDDAAISPSLYIPVISLTTLWSSQFLYHTYYIAARG